MSFTPTLQLGAASSSDDANSGKIEKVLNSTGGSSEDAMGTVSLDGPEDVDEAKIKGTKDESGLTVEEIKAKRTAEA